MKPQAATDESKRRSYIETLELAKAIDAWEYDATREDADECILCREPYRCDDPCFDRTALCHPCAQAVLHRLVQTIVRPAEAISTVHEMSFFVPGIPRPKGSWAPIQTDHGVVFVASAKGEPSWSDTCGWYAKQARIKHQWAMIGRKKAVEVDADFLLPRPERPANEYPIGDLDKLLRSAFDAFTGILYTDDAQVSRSRIEKSFVEKDAETGARFTLRPIIR